MRSFQTQRRVEFRDTDAAGIIHFSVFFAWMEESEHEFLRSLGLSVVQSDQVGTISWPRISARCDFIQPVCFEELVDIDISIKRMGEKSVTYGFQFKSSGRPIARGSMASVYCRLQPDQPLQSIAIPAAISSKLAPFVQDAGDSE